MQKKVTLACNNSIEGTLCEVLTNLKKACTCFDIIQSYRERKRNNI